MALAIVAVVVDAGEVATGVVKRIAARHMKQPWSQVVAPGHKQAVQGAFKQRWPQEEQRRQPQLWWAG